MTDTIPSMKARCAPLSVRVSVKERAWLVKAAADAGGMTLSDYVRTRLFDNNGNNANALPATERRKLLAQILGALGKTGLSHAFRELADAAKAGVLPVTPEIEQEILLVCNEVRGMRTDLLRALGLRVTDSKNGGEP